MRKLGLGMLLGVMLASSVQAEEPPADQLRGVTLETADRTVFKLPKEYGRLVNVVVSSEVHYLYFEDPDGVIRVVLIGPRGASPRSRSQLQLLSSDVYTMERGEGSESGVPGKGYEKR